MDYTRKFRELGRHDADRAGGKGASLGEMIQVGIPVPDGFVVLAGTFDRFLQETDLAQEIDAILDSVDHSAIHTVEAASEKIQDLIESRPMPEDIKVEIMAGFQKLGATYVAVRSSATAEDGAEHAWAGQLESFLNTTEETLPQNVQRCWASLFTPRAIFYRFEKGLHGTVISVAVVVQQMVESEVSGIAFSVHPVTEDYNQLIIEAGLGLGEAIVSGSVTPDSYVVEKEPRNILDINVAEQSRALYRDGDTGGNTWKNLGEEGKQQKLSREQILELSEIILRIEQHYGFPCDIEWAFAGGEFYITQSRPITTLSSASQLPQRTLIQKLFTREHSLFYVFVWNTSDVLGLKTWTNQELVNSVFVGEGIKKKIHVYYDPNDFEQFTRRIRERALADPEYLQEVFGAFDEAWQRVLPYLKKEVEIDSLERLKDFYHHFIKWWSPMAVVMNVPDIPELSEADRELAIQKRTETEKYSDAGDGLFLEFFSRYFPQYDAIKYVITPHEIFSLQEDNLTEEEIGSIKKRLAGYLVTNQTIYLKEDTERILEEKGLAFENVDTDPKGLIEGTIAYRGKVQGKVRKLLYKEQIVDLQEGEVLVAEMTAPDYLPAMRKAIAFVTDEGGITCHAAIVSRELKKPCIIGTKIATQVLKDGDQVEVDADTGVVRVLEKAGNKDAGSDCSNLPDNPDKYTFSWGGQSIPLLFEDLLAHSLTRYPFIDTFWVQHDCNLRVYWSKEARKAATKYGQETFGTLSQAEAYAQKLEALTKQALAVRVEAPVKREDAREIWEIFQAFLYTYIAFDPEFTNDFLESCGDTALIGCLGTLKNQYRESTNQIFFSNQSPYYAVVGEIAKTLGATPEAVHGLSLEQLESVWDGQQPTMQGHTFYLRAKDGQVQHCYSTERVLELMEKFAPGNGDTAFSGELKGVSVAKKGIYRGRVQRLVLNYQDFLKEVDAKNASAGGGILVADHTTPELLPIMQKSVAIVTDMGGILSHAAITSREMNLPCVVGTDIATQVLHDGDLVEVDADNGVVRILEQKSSIKEKILQYKWEKWIERPYYAFFQSCFEPSTLDATYERLGFTGIGLRAQLFQNGYWYFCEEIMEETRMQIEAFFQNHTIFDVTSALDRYVQTAEIKIREIQSSQLPTKEKFEEFYQVLSPVTAFVWLAHGIEVYYKKRIAEEGPRYVEGDYDTFIADASFPIRKNEHALMEEMMRTSATDQEIADAFGWLRVRDCVSEPFSPEEVHEMRRHLADAAPHSSVEVPEGLKSLVEELQELIYYRTARTDAFYKLCFLGRPIMQELADDLGISLRDMQFYRAQSLSSDTPEKYDKKHAFATYGSQVLFQNEPLLQEADTQNTESIRGVVAYKGKVQGRVMIVKSTAELGKVSVGDILVTQMTFPSFLPAMQKAIAFVTDEGGITCHAAIIAREMKKPCIIGTKIATQVLQDGDLVEVDAERGVVTILERAESQDTETNRGEDGNQAESGTKV